MGSLQRLLADIVTAWDELELVDKEQLHMASLGAAGRPFPEAQQQSYDRLAGSVQASLNMLERLFDDIARQAATVTCKLLASLGLPCDTHAAPTNPSSLPCVAAYSLPDHLLMDGATFAQLSGEACRPRRSAVQMRLAGAALSMHAWLLAA